MKEKSWSWHFGRKNIKSVFHLHLERETTLTDLTSPKLSGFFLWSKTITELLFYQYHNFNMCKTRYGFVKVRQQQKKNILVRFISTSYILFDVQIILIYQLFPFRITAGSSGLGSLLPLSLAMRLWQCGRLVINWVYSQERWC